MDEPIFAARCHTAAIHEGAATGDTHQARIPLSGEYSVG